MILHFTMRLFTNKFNLDIENLSSKRPKLSKKRSVKPYSMRQK